MWLLLQERKNLYEMFHMRATLHHKAYQHRVHAAAESMWVYFKRQLQIVPKRPYESIDFKVGLKFIICLVIFMIWTPKLTEKARFLQGITWNTYLLLLFIERNPFTAKKQTARSRHVTRGAFAPKISKRCMGNFDICRNFQRIKMTF